MRKRGLTRDSEPILVACGHCGTPRLDIKPFWFVPEEGTPEAVRGPLYVAPYAECPKCAGQGSAEDDSGRAYYPSKHYHPVSRDIPWVSSKAVWWGGSLYPLLQQRELGEKRVLERATRVTSALRSPGEDIVLEGENAPMMIPGSEVYIRLPAT